MVKEKRKIRPIKKKQENIKPNNNVKSIINESNNHTFKPYPDITSDNFYQEIYEKKEFRDSEILHSDIHDESSCNPVEFSLSPFQTFLKNYISVDTPYNGVLVMYSTGVGKTCAAISIAEGFKKMLKQMGKRILVLTTIPKTFQDELFNFAKEERKKSEDEVVQCTGRDYELSKDVKHLSKKQKKNEVLKLIRTYYQFLGYQKFANYIIKATNGWDGSEEKTTDQIRRFIHKEFDDRVIIIDEVHNIKTDEKEEWKKKIQPILLSIVKIARNTKLILMSATPMFDRQDEIIFILNLLLANDGRELVDKNDIFKKDDTLTEEALTLLPRLLKGYVSYARGERPLTFPFRLYPKEASVPLVEYEINGRHIDEDKSIKFTKIIQCEMESIQNNTYEDYIKEKMKEGKFRQEVNTEDLSTLQEETDEEVIANAEVNGQSMEEVMEEIKIKKKKKKKNNVEEPKSLLKNLTYISNIVYPQLDDDGDLMNTGSFGKEGINNIEKNNPKAGFYRELIKSEGKNIAQYKYTPHAILNKNTPREAPFIDESNLEKYSSKFYKILHELKKAQGLCFVYSTFVDNGVLPLAMMLEQNGFTRATVDGEKSILNEPIGKGGKRDKICYLCGEKASDPNHTEKTAEKNKYHIFRPAKYIIYFGEQKDIIRTTKETALDRFTSNTNKYGEEIKVFLGTKTVSEGLNFKRIRQVHILEPWWNLSRHEQIIGRAIRNCSHMTLPLEHRNVEVFQYASILNHKTKGFKKNTESIDLRYYRKAENKDRVIKKITRILKQSAVDCNLFKKHNIIDTDEEIQQQTASGETIMVKVKDDPFSPMCDYEEECNYDCSWKLDPHKKYPINTDTYNLRFGSQDIIVAIRLIKNLFRRNNAYHLTEIEKYIQKKNPKIDRIFIYAALDKLINNPKIEFITDKFRRKGYLIYRGDYYIFQPFGLREDLPMLYREKPSNYKPDSVDLELIEVSNNVQLSNNTQNDQLNIESVFKYIQQIHDACKSHIQLLNNTEKNKFLLEYKNAVISMIISMMDKKDFKLFMKIIIKYYLLNYNQYSNININTDDEQLITKSSLYDHYIPLIINNMKNNLINYFSMVKPEKRRGKQKDLYIGFFKGDECLVIEDLALNKDLDIKKLDKINIRFIRCPSSIKTKIQDQLTLFKKIKTGQNNTIDKNQIYGFFDEKEGKFKLVNKEEETGVKTTKGEKSIRSIKSGRDCDSFQIPILKSYRKVLDLYNLTSKKKRDFLCEDLQIYLRFKQNVEDKTHSANKLYFYTL